MMIIDVNALAWAVASVAAGLALATLLIAVFESWWLIERRATEVWASIPVVAHLRLRREREDWRWWWANLTPEEVVDYRRRRAAMEQMTRELNRVVRAMGVSADVVAEGLHRFAEASTALDGKAA